MNVLAVAMGVFIMRLNMLQPLGVESRSSEGHGVQAIAASQETDLL